MPMLEISPSNPWMQWMQSTLTKFLPRERFTNFKGLLEDHIDFNEIERLLKPDSPALLIGAANVKQGNLKIFSSHNGEIRSRLSWHRPASLIFFPPCRLVRIIIGMACFQPILRWTNSFSIGSWARLISPKKSGSSSSIRSRVKSCRHFPTRSWTGAIK